MIGTRVAVYNGIFHLLRWWNSIDAWHVELIKFEEVILKSRQPMKIFNCNVNLDSKDLSWFLEGHPLTASLKSQPDALPSTNLLKNFSMNTGWGEKIEKDGLI